MYMHIWLRCRNVFVNLLFGFVMQLSDLKSNIAFLISMQNAIYTLIFFKYSFFNSIKKDINL